jgi:hypothetical protein
MNQKIDVKKRVFLSILSSVNFAKPAKSIGRGTIFPNPLPL